MWAALSTEPSVSSMPLHGSRSIMARPASVVQTSPPRWAGSVPTAKRWPSSGYIQAGGVVPVPYVSELEEST